MTTAHHIIDLGLILRTALAFDIDRLQDALFPLVERVAYAAPGHPALFQGTLPEGWADEERPHLRGDALPCRELGPFLEEHPGLIVPHALAEALRGIFRLHAPPAPPWLSEVRFLRELVRTVKNRLAESTGKTAERLETSLEAIANCGSEIIDHGMMRETLTQLRKIAEHHLKSGRPLRVACGHAAIVFCLRGREDAALAARAIWGPSSGDVDFDGAPGEYLSLLRGPSGLEMLDLGIRTGAVVLANATPDAKDSWAHGWRKTPKTLAGATDEILGPHTLWKQGREYDGPSLVGLVADGMPPLPEIVAQAKRLIRGIHSPLRPLAHRLPPWRAFFFPCLPFPTRHARAQDARAA